jgi:hypothetical protein
VHSAKDGRTFFGLLALPIRAGEVPEVWLTANRL